MSDQPLTMEQICDPTKGEENSPRIADMLAKGNTFQSIFKLSAEKVANQYDYAVRMFERKEFIEATTAFTLLVCLNPYDKRYWLGLAGAQLNCDDPLNAIHSYTLAASIDPTDPYPYFHLTSCFLAIGEREDAIISLELTVEAAKKGHEHRQLEERAAKLLEKLRKA